MKYFKDHSDICKLDENEEVALLGPINDNLAGGEGEVCFGRVGDPQVPILVHHTPCNFYTVNMILGTS